MIKLEWDSYYWGLDLYNITADYNFSIPKLENQESKEWLIQALVPEKERTVINRLEDKGFRFVETKVTLVKKIKNSSSDSEGVFKAVKYSDLEIYKNKFYELFGEYSRFNIFHETKVNDFYYLWLMNSIDGKMDDACIGYFVEEKLAGYITYRVLDSELSIGLFGVFPKFQGRGIGHQLLNWVNNMALNKGYDNINVSTQGCNYNAINTYIKNGFVIKDIRNWYYLRGDNYDTI